MFLSLLASLALKDATRWKAKIHDDYTVTISEEDKFVGDDYSCTGILDRDNFNETGWYELFLNGREGEDPYKMGFCLGYMEGYYFHTQIWQQVNLFKDSISISRKSKGEKPMRQFMKQNLRYLNQSIDAYPDVLNWKRVNATLSMFYGMLTGFNDKAPSEEEKLEEVEFYMYVAMGDTMELRGNLGYIPMNSEILQKCTALIKFSPEFDDIYVAHNAWTDLRLLHYQIVHYYMPTDLFPSKRVSLATDIGLLSSVDDYFINDQGLVVFETTFTLQNRTLYTDYCSPKTVLNWHRTLLAMFVGTDCATWTEMFLFHNSGTYNNEYYVVDSKLLKGTERVKANLVWAVPQLPGPFNWATDYTDELYEEGFIASFNVPHVQNASRFMQFELAYGLGPGFCDYYTCCRYTLAKRESPRIKNYDIFKTFMRYSEFERDDYGEYYGYKNSRCTMNQRGDIEGTLHAGINTKSVRVSRARTTMEIDLINSPSYDVYPPFNVSKMEMNRDGLPEIWNFPWIVRSNGLNICDPLSKDECLDTNFCGWCGKDNKCHPGDKNGQFQGKCPSGWKVDKNSSVRWEYIAYPIFGVAAIVVVVLIGFGLYRTKKNDQSTPLLINSTINLETQTQ